MRGVSQSGRSALRRQMFRRRTPGRRLRQRWRWVPLSARLKGAQLRSRLGHRRAILRAAVAVVGIVLVGSTLVEAEPEAEVASEISIPEDHRVLSIAIDERVPPLEPGDLVDLYLGMGGFAGTEGEVDAMDEPGLVISIADASFTVAVPDDEVGPLATALSSGSVLVVRR